MKKMLIATVIFILTYTGMAFLAGYLGEKNIRAQLALIKNQGNSTGYTLDLLEYHRHLFTTDVKLQLHLTNQHPALQKLSFISDSRLYHGPILFSDGISLGLFSALSHLTLTTGNEDTDKTLADLFGKTLGELHAIARFDSTYTAKWRLPAVNYNANEKSLTTSASQIEINGNYHALAAKIRVSLGDVHFRDEKGNEVQSTPITGDIDIQSINEVVKIANWRFSIDTLSTQNNAQVKSTFQNIAIEQQQKNLNDKIDTQIKFSLDQMTGPLEMTNAYFTLELNQLSLLGLTEWANAMNHMKADPQDVLAYQNEVVNNIKKVFPRFMVEGLQLSLQWGANYKGTTPKGTWLTHYVAPPDNKKVEDITEPMDILRLFDSELHITIPKVAVTGFPLEAYLDSYLTADDTNYLLDGTLKNGAMVIGKKVIPIDGYVDILSSFIPSSAPQATP